MAKLIQFATSNYKGTGTVDALTDMSSGDLWGIRPDNDQKFVIYRMVLLLEDNQIVADNFGNLSALSTGVGLRIKSNASGITTLWPERVKTSAEFGSYSYDTDVKTWGPGNEFLLARFSFNRFGDPITLRGGKGYAERLELLFNDSFVGLVKHRYCFQGESFSL